MAPRKISEEVRREKCRNKEARRAEQINGAFNSLLKSIPYIPETQRPTMPKIKTLRLAMKYIQHLSQILEGQWAFAGNSQENPRPLQFDDFQVYCGWRDQGSQLQRTEAKRKQRCSETTAPTLLPPQTQPPHVFYSTSSPSTTVVPPIPNQFETYSSMPQYPALPRVDTVYGSCSPPDLFYQNPLMSSDEEWRF
ncbi:unnamed protein product [Caenorhabditis angaria]|uniref:BHLH domain-containing protein n=1 Tax=Caenorhabditis angaria TaxID=860376 RepID=A0A9P1I882_9PELO|nr:unnamed protein product [Caenorhabditis angaria]